MCLKLPQMTQMVRIYGKNTKRRKDVQGTMSAARQASLMESWNIIEDTTVAHFVIPLKVNTKCFLIQWISVPMIQLLPVFLCFLLLLLLVILFRYFLDTMTFTIKMSSPASGILHTSQYISCFYSSLFLLPAVLSLYALHLNGQSKRIHYFSWFYGTKWKEILSPKCLMDLVLVQSLIRLVVARILNYLL